MNYISELVHTPIITCSATFKLLLCCFILKQSSHSNLKKASNIVRPYPPTPHPCLSHTNTCFLFILVYEHLQLLTSGFRCQNSTVGN